MKKLDFLFIKSGDILQFTSNLHRVQYKIEDGIYDEEYYTTAIDRSDNVIKPYQLTLSQFRMLNNEFPYSKHTRNEFVFTFLNNRWHIKATEKDLSDEDLELDNSFNYQDILDYIKKVQNFHITFM